MSREEGKETERARAQEVSLGYARKEETAREEGGRGEGRSPAREKYDREGGEGCPRIRDASVGYFALPLYIIRVFKAN